MLHTARTTIAEPEPVQSSGDWAQARLRALSGRELHERFEAWDLHAALAQLGSTDPARRAAGERRIARWRAGGQHLPRAAELGPTPEHYEQQHF